MPAAPNPNATNPMISVRLTVSYFTLGSLYGPNIYAYILAPDFRVPAIRDGAKSAKRPALHRRVGLQGEVWLPGRVLANFPEVSNRHAQQGEGTGRDFEIRSLSSRPAHQRRSSLGLPHRDLLQGRRSLFARK